MATNPKGDEPLLGLTKDIATVLVGMDRALSKIEKDVTAQLQEHKQEADSKLAEATTEAAKASAAAKVALERANAVLVSAEEAEHRATALASDMSAADERSRAALESQAAAVLSRVSLQADEVLATVNTKLGYRSTEVQAQLQSLTTSSDALLVELKRRLNRISADLSKQAKELAQAATRIDEERAVVVRMLIDLDQKTAAHQAKVRALQARILKAVIAAGAVICIALLYLALR